MGVSTAYLKRLWDSDVCVVKDAEWLEWPANVGNSDTVEPLMGVYQLTERTRAPLVAGDRPVGRLSKRM